MSPLAPTLLAHAAIFLVVLGLTLPFSNGSFIAGALAAAFALEAAVKLRWAADPVSAGKLKIRLAAALLLIAAEIAGGPSRARRLERRLAPAIAALSAFHGAKHDYPEKLDELVPRYLAAAPDCGLTPVFYTRASDKSFRIGCNSFAFTKHAYDSARARWYDWD